MSQRRTGLIVAALALVAIAAPLSADAQQAAAYNNPLDSSNDTSGWYIYDDYGYWAVDATPIAGHDGVASLNMNDGNGIDNAYYNYFYFETAPINLSGMDSPILSFWCIAEFPSYSNNYVDRALYLYDANGNNFNYYSMGEEGWGFNLECTAEWHQHLIQIPSDIVSAGTMRIQQYGYYENYNGDSGLQGLFFDQLQVLVADITPPDAVTNLTASGATLTSIQLDWTAPFDDDVSGVTASYDLRFSTSPITGTTFNSATQVQGEPVPDVEGTPHSVVITNLTENTTYYFAIQSTDIAGNPSAISNVATLATLAPPPPPPPITPNVAPADIKEPPDDILPCSAGTTAAPMGLASLAGLILLAFTLRRKV